MFKRKLGFAVLAVMMTVALVLSGCTKEKSPKDALQSSLSKSADIKSYNFKGSVKVEDFNFPDDELNANEAAAIVNTLKSAELSWTGAYRADPMLLEINLEVALKGDLAVTFKVPIIMTQKKIWVKVPNIPMLPLPETIIGKYIELDLEELAKEANQPMPSLNVAQSQKFYNDVAEIIFKHVEEEKFLSKVAVKDAAIPADVDVKQVVQLHVDQTQIEPLINTAVEKIAPEIIELLANNKEYLDLFELKKEDLDQFKKELAEVKSEDISKGLADMKNELKKLDVKVNYGIDKKEYPVYTDATFNMAIESEELTGSFGFRVTSQNTGINEEPKFETGEPKAEEIMTLEQLQNEVGALYGGGF
ncbi:hypothetical protein [Cohnella boryungensis]|uniref:Lipoprotein n=1 Tax=Cohnella boryungensis TaxID=768479 RepID=A0ABV8S9K4_9BACL